MATPAGHVATVLTQSSEKLDPTTSNKQIFTQQKLFFSNLIFLIFVAQSLKLLLHPFTLLYSFKLGLEKKIKNYSFWFAAYL